MHNRNAAAETAELPEVPVGGLRLQRLTQAIRGFSAEQLLWSSGYLAGLAAAIERHAGPVEGPATAERPAQAARLTVLYGSQGGNARSVAESLGRRAAAAGIAHLVVSTADFRPRDLLKERLVLLVISTQGEGEPPESALGLYRWLHGTNAPSLGHLGFAVFGLGDSSYERFCQAARDFDLRLEGLGARRLLERVDADLDFAGVSQTWVPLALERAGAELESLAPARHREAEVVQLRAPAPLPARHDRNRPYRAKVLDNRPITARDSVGEVRHLALEVDPGSIRWSPGDSLAVRFRNDPALVERLLAATGLDGESRVGLDGERSSLAEALASRLELTRLHPSVALAWAELAGAAGLADLAGDRAGLRAWCGERQVLDLATRFPARPDPERLVGLLQPLAPRLYSIASSQAQQEDEIHLSVGVLRLHRDGEERLGGASGFLSARLTEGDGLDCWVAENPAFRLPEDGDTPLILVGAGTGIAPFRAFIQERAARGERGRNWLVFGNRHFRRDFLYQTDWLRLRREGWLHRFSPAFSRDGAERVYVQDRLLAEGATLWRWLDEGARIYCCGATAMELGVREALVRVAQTQGGLGLDSAADFVDNLRQEARYLRDTY
jgi:sulfite reductase (NADPH) flavoprotein alpha-component